MFTLEIVSTTDSETVCLFIFVSWLLNFFREHATFSWLMNLDTQTSPPVNTAGAACDKLQGAASTLLFNLAVTRFDLLTFPSRMAQSLWFGLVIKHCYIVIKAIFFQEKIPANLWELEWFWCYSADKQTDIYIM